MTDKKKRKLRSLIDIPIKVEMSPVEHMSDHALTPDELALQIEEARKGKARVNSKYVGNAEGLGHLFDYKLDYARFLDNMKHIITEAKKHKEEDRYKNSHEMIIQ